MSVRAVEELGLTDQAIEELGRDLTRPGLFDWCQSLWGDNPRHQCVRRPHHAGVCECACGASR